MLGRFVGDRREALVRGSPAAAFLSHVLRRLEVASSAAPPRRRRAPPAARRRARRRAAARRPRLASSSSAARLSRSVAIAVAQRRRSPSRDASASVAEVGDVAAASTQVAERGRPAGRGRGPASAAARRGPSGERRQGAARRAARSRARWLDGLGRRAPPRAAGPRSRAASRCHAPVERAFVPHTGQSASPWRAWKCERLLEERRRVARACRRCVARADCRPPLRRAAPRRPRATRGPRSGGSRLERSGAGVARRPLPARRPRQPASTASTASRSQSLPSAAATHAPRALVVDVARGRATSLVAHRRSPP